MVERVGINMGNLKELSKKMDKNAEILKRRTDLEDKAWAILGEDKPDMDAFNALMDEIDEEKGMD